MLKKLVVALGVTTICSTVQSVYSFPNNDQEKDQVRGMTAKRTIVTRVARIERLQERRRVQMARKKTRLEGLVERRKMRQMASLLRKQRVVESRSNRHIMKIKRAVNSAMKLEQALNTVRLKNTSIKRRKRTEFAHLLDRPNVKEVLRHSIYPEIIGEKEPIGVSQHIETARSFGEVQNLQTPTVVMTQSYPTLDVIPVDFEEVPRHSQASQTPTILEETPQETFGMTPILETVGAAIQYVKDIFTPTPTDEETPFYGEGDTPLAQSLIPQETETPFEGEDKTPLAQSLPQTIPSKVGNLEGSSSEDAGNPEHDLEARVSKILFDPPSVTKAILFSGKPLRSGSSSSEDRGNPERKVPTLPLSSPNSVRVMGTVLRSGSSSSEDSVTSSPGNSVTSSPGRFRAKKISLKMGLEPVKEEAEIKEEPEIEITLTTLQPKLKFLVGLKDLRLPPQETCRKNAADSFCKLRARIENQEKTAVPGDLVKELSTLLESIETYLPRMEQDTASSPRTGSIENANVKYVDNWLNELLRLNPKSDQ